MVHSVSLCLALLGQQPHTAPSASDSDAAHPTAQRSTLHWNAGDAPLDDMNVPPPGAIEPPLDIIERDPSNWLGLGADQDPLEFIRDPLRELNESYGLLFTTAYTMLFQQSMGPGAQSAAGGDLDITARWTFVGRGTKDTGSLYIAGEYRHAIGDRPPSVLGPEIGTLLATTNGFNDRGWAVKEAYFVQRLFDDHLRFGVGRVDPENLVGAHDLQSANTSFLNKAFSTNPSIAFPGSGIGAAATVRPVEWMYFSGGASNAYGNTTQFTIDTLDEWRLFTFAEIGFTPAFEGVGKGKYRVAFWHTDSRSLTDQPGDGGVTVIGDQKIGEDLALFARYGYADGDLTKVEHSLQVGCGYEGLVGSTSDLTGLALGWSRPVADLRDEKVVEFFHRMQLTVRTQCTVGVQVIIDPSHAPDVDALGVFSARLRITF